MPCPPCLHSKSFQDCPNGCQARRLGLDDGGRPLQGARSRWLQCLVGVRMPQPLRNQPQLLWTQGTMCSSCCTTKAGADSAKAEASLHQQDTGASATSLLEVGVHHHPILAFVLGSHLDSPGKIYYGDKEGMAW